MPLYDQMSSSLPAEWLPNGPGGSMLCAPVSGAMVLAGQVHYAGAGNPARGWTATEFVPATWQNRVANMASLMSTNAVTGTFMIPLLKDFYLSKGVAGRAGDFMRPGLGGASATPMGVSGRNIEPLISARAGVVLGHGHFTRNSTTILGTEYVTFARNGGHFVAVSGFTRQNSSPEDDVFTIQNPAGGVKQWLQIQTLNGGLFWEKRSFGPFPYWVLKTAVILPVLSFQAGYLEKSGTYYSILEGFTHLAVP